MLNRSSPLSYTSAVCEDDPSHPAVAPHSPDLSLGPVAHI